MARYMSRVHRSTTPSGDMVETRETSGRVYNDSPSVFAQRLVGFSAGLLLVILAFRFVLALLGANSANWFAHFIYSISYPFVAPFFGLFSYNYSYGISRFEGYTLVAMVVYAFLAWGIMALVDLFRRP